MNDTLPNEGQTSSQDAAPKDEFDYDSLLKEYDEGKAPEPKGEPRPDPAVRELLKGFKPIAEVAEKHLRKEAADEEQKLVKAAIGTVKEEESLAKVSDTIVEGYLNLQYIRNTEFRKACDARSENPTGWTQALVKAREGLAADISSLSKSSDKDDTEAALAAVKGTSQTELDRASEINPKDLFAMSDQDFAEYKRNLGS